MEDIFFKSEVTRERERGGSFYVLGCFQGELDTILCRIETLGMILGSIEMLGWNENIYESQEVMWKKPWPAIFVLACGELGRKH